MIGDILYNIVVAPIELVVELIFEFLYRQTSSAGLSIIGVSLIINFLVLPLYKKSDAIQEEDRAKQKKMEPWLKHIRRTFKGDERYMMQSAYYAEQHYKPVYAIKGSLSLLLQIPFFIAAYHFLSNLHLLQGAQFLILNDLSRPDGLIRIGGLTVNLLPVLMTLINIISGAIYTRGFPLKEKLQLYGMALVFLVLLYGSPSGLVFYWTLNNLFSLLKNVVMKLIRFPERKPRPQPALMSKSLFYLATVFITLLAGLVIPLSVISGSPTEFISVNYGPGYLIVHTLSFYVGLMLLWCTIFYMLCDNRWKNIFTCGMWILAGVCLADFLFFGGKFGNMSAYLVFDELPVTKLSEKLINAAVLAVLAAAMFFAARYKESAARFVMKVLIVAAVAVSVWNIIGTSRTLGEARRAREAMAAAEDRRIPLSRDGKNVVVFMLDRALSGFVPQILEEKPELKEQLDGFTYYPNTVSFGWFTNFCTPSLFGGYEYTPKRMDERSSELIADKHNEAMQVLPALFDENDYDVTVVDPPYAGSYAWVPDVSLYDKYENVNAFLLDSSFTGESDVDAISPYAHAFEARQKRNFICYSLFKCAPLAVQLRFYDYGHYYTTAATNELRYAFLTAYSALHELPEITDVTEGENTFLMMQNSATHEPMHLEAPDYVPDENSRDVDDSTWDECHYCVNMSSLLQMGRWFGYMREQGVYDNTRIIIVSDHGNAITSLSDGNPLVLMPRYNPLFMVKDFGASGFTTDDTFMTIADVATLATEGVIEDPVNPFTGKRITDEDKYAGPVWVNTSTNWDVDTNNGYTFDYGDGEWYTVHDNIFDHGNWEKAD